VLAGRYRTATGRCLRRLSSGMISGSFFEASLQSVAMVIGDITECCGWRDKERWRILRR
jgi:hypothetical protein